MTALNDVFFGRIPPPKKTAPGICSGCSPYV